MRVLTVLDSYPPDLNGGAYFMHRFAKSLRARGLDVLVVCPSRTTRNERRIHEGVPVFGARSFPVMLYDGFRVSWPIALEDDLRTVLEQFDPDVVHLQGKFFLGGIVYRLARERDLPLVATNHFMPENFFHYTRLPRAFEPWFKRVTWGIVRDMLEQVDLVTTPTETAAALLRSVGLRKPVHAVSCGVDLDTFRPGRDATKLRRRLGLDSRPVLLYTGRLDAEKRLHDVLRAFAAARRSVDAQLVLTGMGAEEKSLRKLARALGLGRSICFTGLLADEDYPDVFGLADAFVHAGIAELQSIVALEAVASGLPMLCANAMALPELVTDGDNGFLFEPGDLETMRARMVRMLSDPALRARMGERSRERARAHAIARTAQRYEELYVRMLEERKGARRPEFTIEA